MMFILDSGVFIPRFRLKTPAIRTLLFDRDQAVLVGVPRVVLLEVKNKFRETTAKAIKLMDGLGVSFWPGGTAEEIRNHEADNYSTWLDEQLNQAGVQILETPPVPHDQVVDRALKRRRPFDNNGHNGYRDALIWETVLAAAAKEQVVFVSKNSKDFGDNGKLHRDLAEDRQTAGYADDQILYYGTLQAAVEAHIEAAWADATDRWPEFREATEHYARQFMLHQLGNRSYSPAQLGLPVTIENTSIAEVKITKVDLRSFRRSPAGELHALLDVTAELHIDAVMPQSPVLTIPSQMGEIFDYVRAVAEITAKISLAMEEEEKTPSSFEIVFGPTGRASLEQ